MSSKIPSGSDRAKLARAMVNIFRSPSGKVLRGFLERDTLGPLSAIGPGGALVDDRTLMFVEGQKAMAKKLIEAADVDGKLLGEGDQP